MSVDVDAYLAALPDEQRRPLEHLRDVIVAEVPDAEQAIRTRVPAIRWRDKTVVGFCAGARHLALYVMFGDALRVLSHELKDFDVSSKVVRFSAERPPSDALVRKIARIRMKEIAAQTASRR